jgi:hypothetical protein
MFVTPVTFASKALSMQNFQEYFEIDIFAKVILYGVCVYIWDNEVETLEALFF